MLFEYLKFSCSLELAACGLWLVALINICIIPAGIWLRSLLSELPRPEEVIDQHFDPRAKAPGL